MKVKEKEFLTKEKDMLENYREHHEDYFKKNPHHVVEIRYSTDYDSYVLAASLIVYDPRGVISGIIMQEEIIDADGNLRDDWFYFNPI